MKEMEQVDKDKLIKMLVESMPEMKKHLGFSYDDLERATGIGTKRLSAFEEGRQKPKWTEFLSVLFVLRVDENCRAFAEETGLFPPELKRAFSVNRNAHKPTI